MTFRANEFVRRAPPNRGFFAVTGPFPGPTEPFELVDGENLIPKSRNPVGASRTSKRCPFRALLGAFEPTQRIYTQ